MYQGKMPGAFGAHRTALQNECSRRQPAPTCRSGYRALPPAAGLLLPVMMCISACSERLVPLDAVLRLTPETHEAAIVPERDDYGRCQLYADQYMDIPLQMQLSTADGTPIGDTTLLVHADYTAQRYSGYPLVQLYDDRNGNGVVDEQSELVSGADHDAVTVKTDRWSGSRGLLIRINLSCAFKSNVRVIAGGVSAQASIEVKATEPSASYSEYPIEEWTQ